MDSTIVGKKQGPKSMCFTSAKDNSQNVTVHKSCAVFVSFWEQIDVEICLHDAYEWVIIKLHTSAVLTLFFGTQISKKLSIFLFVVSI